METLKSTCDTTDKEFEESNKDSHKMDIHEFENLIEDSKEHSRKCKLSIFPSKHFFSQSCTGNTNHDTVLDEPELVLHRDEFPYLGAGDIVEIYQPDVDSGSEDPFPSLLLKVCILLLLTIW